MENYESLSDEELIIRSRDGEGAVTDFLMNKYKNMVRKKAGAMFIIGGDTEDLIQEGMIGLFKAIRDYDFGRDASFVTFADLCISRQMYTAVQAANRKKHAPLNGAVSIYAEGEHLGEEHSEVQLVNALASAIDRNPEELIIDNENVRALSEFLERELSSFEKEVLELRLTGMNYVEIARILGKDEKSTDNALQRIKNKVKKQF